MKKFVSFLLGAVVCGAMFTATAFAAESNVSITLDKTEVAVGETVKVSVNVGDVSAASFGTGFYFDKAVFELTEIIGADGDDFIYLIDADKTKRAETEAYVVSSIEEANAKGVVSALWSDTANINYAAGLAFTATLKAKDVLEDTEVAISWFEETDNDGDDSQDVSLDPAGSKKVTVKAPVQEPTVTWKEADASWTAPEGKKAIWWPFDYEANTFPGHVFVEVTDGTRTETIGIGANTGYDVNGAVSFAVAVILDAEVDATNFNCVVK